MSISIETAKFGWLGSNVEDKKVQATIDKFESLKSFGTNKILDVATELNISDGFAFHVAKAVKESRKVFVAPSVSQSRIDRILRTRDSSGKATSRRFR